VHLVADRELLDGEEPLAVQAVTRALEADGVRLHSGYRTIAAENAGRIKAVVIERDGARHKLLVDQIVLTAGSRANLQRMGLQAAGIRAVGDGASATVQVDTRLATSNARVFAVGGISTVGHNVDALERMCSVAVQNAVGSTRRRYDRWLTPRLLATDPQVARIGVTASEAKSRGMEVDSWLIRPGVAANEPVRFDPQSCSIERVGATSDFAIVHTLCEPAGRIAGATLVGDHAQEGLGVVSLLLAEELTLSVLSTSIVPQGTFARALAQLGGLIQRNERAGKRRAR
jgi:pyruvate/2-oxoglutarate dehydrogenase complex dihydrolipoamide dehydrogenase (E3) component